MRRVFLGLLIAVCVGIGTADSQPYGVVPTNAPSGNPAINIGTNTYTFGNATDNPNYVFAGSGALSGNGLSTVLLQSAIPFVVSSSCTMANNGAVSVCAAMPYTIGASYSYWPANAICTANTAGWYWTVWSSTTAGTIYNNTYPGGQPEVVASPTAFVCSAGSGTQTSAAVTAMSATVPANAMGVNGSIEIINQMHLNNAASNHYWQPKFGGTALIAVTETSTSNAGLSATIMNRGLTNSQSTVVNGGGGGTFSTIDTTSAQTISINIQISTVASDFIILDNYSLKISPHN